MANARRPSGRPDEHDSPVPRTVRRGAATLCRIINVATTGPGSQGPGTCQEHPAPPAMTRLDLDGSPAAAERHVDGVSSSIFSMSGVPVTDP